MKKQKIAQDLKANGEIFKSREYSKSMMRRRSKDFCYKLRGIKEYLTELKGYIIFIVGSFILSALFGFLNARALSSLILPFLENLIGQTAELRGIGLIRFIFMNNAFISFAGLFLGIFLGIFPVITTITNGVVLGFVLERTAVIAGFLEWWRLLPHGIFELPAVFISLALGIRLGFQPVINYFKFYSRKNRAMLAFPFLIALPLIIIAILGVTISPNTIGEKIDKENSGNYVTFSPEFSNGQFSKTSNTNNRIVHNIALPQPMLFLFFIFMVSITYIGLSLFVFIFTTLLANKKLRKVQLNTLKKNFYYSVIIFIFIIIPLLIIAAIIEGILISVI